MTLLAASDASSLTKLAYAALVLVPTTTLTAWPARARAGSRTSSRRCPTSACPGRAKLAALVDAWRRRRPA